MIIFVFFILNHFFGKFFQFNAIINLTKVISMDYGKLMKDLRFRNNLRQEDVAKILNLAKSTYNDYEQQYVIIPIKHLLTFCNYFDISVDYFLGFNTIKQYPNINKEVDLKESGIRLRKLRREAKLHQYDLASSIKTTNSILSKNERGHLIISTTNLYAICKKYEISADYLLGRIDTKIKIKSKKLLRS